MTHLLVDFEGMIIAVTTNVLGHMHDSSMAQHNIFFKEVLGPGRFALGDPGFSGVPYVVSGLTTPQLRTQADLKFDDITRSEQSIVEHVNNFIKKCEVLSKSSKFIHKPQKLVNCVFILCGWLNWMRTNFDKYTGK